MRLIFLLPILITSSLLQASEHPPLSDLQKSKLANGEIVLIPARAKCQFTQGGKYVAGAMIVKQSPKQVWTVLNDPAATPNYLKDMIQAKVISKDSQSIQVEQSMKVSGFRSPFNYVVRIYPKEAKQTFVMESGKLRAFDGGWWSFPVEGGTLVVYSLFLDPGRLAPQTIVKRSLTKKIPETMVAVRGEVNRRS